jgi:hypothetical protein
VTTAVIFSCYRVTLSSEKRTTTYPGVLTEAAYVYASMPLLALARARTHHNPAGPYVHVGYVSNVACLLCYTLDVPTHRPPCSVVTFTRTSFFPLSSPPPCVLYEQRQEHEEEETRARTFGHPWGLQEV